MASTRFSERTVRDLAAYAKEATGGRVALADVIRPGDGRIYYCEEQHHRVFTAGREAAAFFLGAAFQRRNRWPANVRNAYKTLQECQSTQALTYAFQTGKTLAR